MKLNNRLVREKREAPKDITFHYTNEQMVKDLIALTPISGSVLDAGSGKNKVWFNNLKGEKYECELMDGVDFYAWDKKVDWVVGNPPFSEMEQFILKGSEIAQMGFAWLLSIRGFNSLTPRRLQLYKNNGFYLTKIHIVSDSRWYGRYYYLIFTKKPNEFLSWNGTTYKDKPIQELPKEKNDT